MNFKIGIASGSTCSHSFNILLISSSILSLSSWAPVRLLSPASTCGYITKSRRAWDSELSSGRKLPLDFAAASMADVMRVANCSLTSMPPSLGPFSLVKGSIKNDERSFYSRNCWLNTMSRLKERNSSWIERTFGRLSLLIVSWSFL